MIYRKHKYLNAEPGDTSGTGTAPEPAASAPSATPSTEPPASTVTETPAPAAKSTEPTSKPADKPDTSAKIGSFLDNIGKPEGEPAAKAPEPEKPIDPAKPVEKAADKPEDNDPPEEASPRAKSRWMELSERAKQVPELERRATEAETQLTSVRQMVAESGLEQNEFAGMLQMGRLFKSSKPEDLQAAMAELDNLRADLATRLGIDAPGVDPLAKHADLAADVENMAISRERALEIAKLRDGQARVQQTQQQTREMTEFQNTVRGAATQMDAALAQRASTPGHAAKVEFIKSQLSDPAKMQQFVSTYRPDQWQAVVLTMYDAYTPPAPPAPSAPQPLRPGVVANGVRQAGNRPVTSTEAVGNAWELAGL
jgi:Skp family chaperone for outer membrane proteins